MLCFKRRHAGMLQKPGGQLLIRLVQLFTHMEE